MTHIAPRPARGAGWFVRLAYRMARKQFGRVPKPFGVVAHHPRGLAAMAAFEITMQGASKAPARLKHLAELKTAMEVGCRFCVDIGTHICEQSGLAREELIDLPFHRESERFSPLEKQVLDYAVEMTATPAPDDPTLFHILREALGTEALIELTAVIAWENFRARFNHAVGGVEEGFSETTVCMLPPAPTPTAVDMQPEARNAAVALRPAPPLHSDEDRRVG